jgi:hypothetical protein
MSQSISLNELNELALQRLSMLDKIDPAAIVEILESGVADLQQDLVQKEAELGFLQKERKRIGAAISMYRNLPSSDRKTIAASAQKLFVQALRRETSLSSEIDEKNYEIKQHRKVLGRQAHPSSLSSFWSAKVNELIADRVPQVLSSKDVIESVLGDAIQSESVIPWLVIIDTRSIEIHKHRIERLQSLLIALEGTRLVLLGERQNHSQELSKLLIKKSTVLPAVLGSDSDRVVNSILSWSRGNGFEKNVLITSNVDGFSKVSRRSLLVCDLNPFLDEVPGELYLSSADVMLTKEPGVIKILSNPSLGMLPLESALDSRYGGYNKYDFNPCSVYGLEVLVGGRYFPTRNENLHNAHYLTQVLLRGKTSFYPELLLSALANEVRKKIRVGCYLTVVPSKPGQRQRMELMLDQLKPYLKGERINVIADIFEFTKNFDTKTLGQRHNRIEVISQNMRIKRKPIRSARVIVIDDIVTTGATLKVCEDLLTSSGVKEIVLLGLGKTHAHR